VTSSQDSNGLVGYGYLFDGQERDLFSLSYGINSFYLAPTHVKGNVVQEDLFNNLSYSYNITHYPLYALAKAKIHTPFKSHDVTLDLGIGPNFMHTSSFVEQPLDGITLPDNPFLGKNTTTFSVMTGIGVKFNHFFGPTPLECGYKFFYLGQGYFKNKTDQILNTYNTGSTYANALMCTLTV
jgi:hypothetical protein